MIFLTEFRMSMKVITKLLISIHFPNVFSFIDNLCFLKKNEMQEDNRRPKRDYFMDKSGACSDLLY